MEKKEFQSIVKNKMKSLGFKSRGNHHYKIIDDDYLIGVSLDHHPYRKAYFIDYGVVYLPDETKLPFKGLFDWDDNFWFTEEFGSTPTLSQLHKEFKSCSELTKFFEYDIRSVDELIESVDVNVERMLNILSDKFYAVNYYKENIRRFAQLDEYTIKKFLMLSEFDLEEVNAYKRGWGGKGIIIEVEEAKKYKIKKQPPFIWNKDNW